MRFLLALFLVVFVSTAALAQGRGGSVDYQPVQTAPAVAAAPAVNAEAQRFADKAREAMYGADNETAVKMLDEAIKLEPRNTQYLYARAMSLINLDRKAGAIWDLQVVIDLEPSKTDAYGHLGKLSYEMRDYDQCVKVLSKGIELNPNSAFLYYQRGQCNYQRVDGQDLVQADFKKAVELDPSYAERLK